MVMMRMRMMVEMVIVTMILFLKNSDYDDTLSDE